MRLAVVIPCYNHERYVGGAIESVLNQTRPPDRFLVIDDGSKDGSVEVIRQYADRGVECITQENAGAHHTINRAIELVSRDADAIAILNSDDAYEPGRFAACLPALEKAAVVTTGLRFIGSDGEFLPEDAPRSKWFRAVWSMARQPEVDLCEWMGLANFPVTTSNVVARSEYLLANPFQPYRFNHDYFFLAGAALRGQLALVPDELLRYRVHPTNTINTDPAPLLKEMLRMQLDLYRALAPELRADAAMRGRFYRYARATWNSVSSLHAGLLQTLFAELAAGQSPEQLEELVRKLDVPELNHYPNSSLVNDHDGVSPLLAGEGLGEKLSEQKRLTREAKTENADLKELNRLRGELGASKWIALGQALGACRVLGENRGKTPAEKLANLRGAVENCGWIRLGRKLGIGG